MSNSRAQRSKRYHRSGSVIISALVAALGAAASAQAQDITYQIYQTSTTPIVSSGEVSPLSVTESGTITTDGTIGALQASDIVSWNLALTDQYNPSYDVTLTPSDSGITPDIGTSTGLTASATALSFNYSQAGAAFGIQALNPGFYSGYRYVCYAAAAGACAQGDTIVPNYYAVDGVQVALTGTQNLNNPPPTTSAPEIDSASAMSAGTLLLGMLVVLRGRRSHKFTGAVVTAQ